MPLQAAAAAVAGNIQLLHLHREVQAVMFPPVLLLTVRGAILLRLVLLRQTVILLPAIVAAQAAAIHREAAAIHRAVEAEAAPVEEEAVQVAAAAEVAADNKSSGSKVYELVEKI